MESAAQALNNAADTTTWAVGMCDQFVASMFGLGSSGYETAVDNWLAVPASDKHPNDMNAPAGALMFWGGGDGHVAISDGSGGIYSTDISGDGTVSHVAATAISTQWGKPYLGWTVPYFNGQAGATEGTPASTTADTNATPASSVGSDIPYWLTGDTGGISFTDTMERFGLILLGGVFLVVGVWKFTAGGGASSPVSSARKARKNGLRAGSREIDETDEEVVPDA